MSRICKFSVLMLAGLWLLASSHCLLEDSGLAPDWGCCPSSLADSGEGHNECGQCSSESAPLVVQKTFVDVPLPDFSSLTVVVLRWHSEEEPRLQSVLVDQDPDISPNAWRVFSERAQPIRGPSLLS